MSDRLIGRCMGCRAPGGGFCGGCGADLREDTWDGKINQIDEADRLEREGNALLANGLVIAARRMYRIADAKRGNR